MASLAAVYQERANFLIYQLDYKQENFFPYCNAITIIIEGLLEAAKLDSFKSQLNVSINWKKILQLK